MSSSEPLHFTPVLGLLEIAGHGIASVASSALPHILPLAIPEPDLVLLRSRPIPLPIDPKLVKPELAIYIEQSVKDTKAKALQRANAAAAAEQLQQQQLAKGLGAKTGSGSGGIATAIELSASAANGLPLSPQQQHPERVMSRTASRKLEEEEKAAALPVKSAAAKKPAEGRSTKKTLDVDAWGAEADAPPVKIVEKKERVKKEEVDTIMIDLSTKIRRPPAGSKSLEDHVRAILSINNPREELDLYSEALSQNTAARQQQHEHASSELLFLIHTLPKVSNPFKDILEETMNFIHQLTATSVVKTKGRATSVNSKKSHKVEEDDDNANDESDNATVKGHKKSEVIPTLWFAAALACVAHPAFIDHASLNEAVLENTIEALQNICKAIKRHLDEVALAIAADSSGVENTCKGRGRAAVAKLTTTATTTAPSAPTTAINRDLATLLDHTRLIIRYFSAAITSSGIPSDTLDMSLKALLPQLLSCPSYGEKAEVVGTLSKYLSEETLLLLHSYFVWVSPNHKGSAIRDIVSDLRWCKELSFGTYKITVPQFEANSAFVGDASAVTPNVSSNVNSNTTATISVMPLTIAVIAAVQAQPIITRADKEDMIRSGTNGSGLELSKIIFERVSENAQLWVRALLQRFFSPTESDILATQTIAEKAFGIHLVSRLADDLSHLVAVPHLPAADILLKALVYHLAKYYIRGEGLHHRHGRGDADATTITKGRGGAKQSATASSEPFDKFRSSAIDILGKLAVSLHRLKAPRAVSGVLQDGPVVDRWSITCQKAEDEHNALLKAKGVGTAPDAAEPAPKKGGRKEKGGGTSAATKSTKDYHPMDLSLQQKIHCSIFNAMNKKAQLCGNVAEGLLWYSARQVHIGMWLSITLTSLPVQQPSEESSKTTSKGKAQAANNQQDTATRTSHNNGISMAVAEALIVDDRETSAPDVNDSVEALSSQILFLSATNRRSVAHPETCESLLLALLSTFRARSGDSDQAGGGKSSAKSEEQPSSAAIDALRKKAIQHLAKLLALYPTLTKAAWHAARDAMSDDSARVREASIPLLMTLVCRSSSGSSTTQQTHEEEEVAAQSLSGLIKLTADPSDSVVTKAVLAVEQVLQTQAEDAIQEVLARQRRPGGTGGVAVQQQRYTTAKLLLSLDRPMVTFILAKLLDIVAADIEGKHKGLVIAVFYRRWFAIGSGGGGKDPNTNTPLGSMADDVNDEDRYISATSATAVKQRAKAAAKVDPNSDDTTSGKKAKETTSLAAATAALPPDVVIEEVIALIDAISAPPFNFADNHPLCAVLATIASSVSVTEHTLSTSTINEDSKTSTSSPKKRAGVTFDAATTAAASSAIVATTAAKGNAKKAISAMLSLSDKERKEINRIASASMMLLVASIKKLKAGSDRALQQDAATPARGGKPQTDNTLETDNFYRDSFQLALRSAVLRLFASASAVWVTSCVTSLVDMVTIPSNLQDENEATCLLHVCATLKAVMQQVNYGVPTDGIVAALVNVISKYRGAHATLILAVCVGGVCASIEPGGLPTGQSSRYRLPSLKLSYKVMNNCYLGTAMCLTKFLPPQQTSAAAASKQPTQAEQTQHNEAFALSLRYLFILSEFLRCYPWNNSFPALEDPTASYSLLSTKSKTAQALQSASGGTSGVISSNVFELLTLAMQKCGSTSTATAAHQRSTSAQSDRTRMLGVVLRVVGSLCILQPADYFKRCESLLHEGLAPAASHENGSTTTTTQIQTLKLITDFLREEERRVNLAATADFASIGVAGDSAQPIVDYNSGMATWLLQQFHGDVLRLMIAPEPSTRNLAFEIIELALDQGLLAPSIYAEALVAATADIASDPPVVANKSMRLLTGILERHEEAIVGKIGRSLVRCFEGALVADNVTAAMNASSQQDTDGLNQSSADGNFSEVGSTQSAQRKIGNSPLQRSVSGRLSANETEAVKDNKKNSKVKQYVAPCVATAVLESAYRPATTMDPAMSCLAPFFSCLSGPQNGAGATSLSTSGNVLLKYRKRRELLLTTLIRYIHQDARLNEVILATMGGSPTASPSTTTIHRYQHQPAAVASVLATSGAATPPSYILFMAASLAFLPLSLETEALTTLQSIRAALDLMSESTEQSMTKLVGQLDKALGNFGGGDGPTKLIAAKSATSHISTLPQNSSHGSGNSNASAVSSVSGISSASSAEQLESLRKTQMNVVGDVTKAVAVIALVAVKRYIKREFGLSPAKLQRLRERSKVLPKLEEDAAVGAEADADADEDNAKSAAARKRRLLSATTNTSKQRVHHLPRRDPNSKASNEFTSAMAALADMLRPLQQEGSHKGASSKKGGLMASISGLSVSVGGCGQSMFNLWHLIADAISSGGQTASTSKSSSRAPPTSRSVTAPKVQPAATTDDNAWLAADEDSRPLPAISPALKPQHATAANLRTSASPANFSSAMPNFREVAQGLQVLRQRLLEALEDDAADIIAEEGGDSTTVVGDRDGSHPPTNVGSKRGRGGAGSARGRLAADEESDDAASTSESSSEGYSSADDDDEEVEEVPARVRGAKSARAPVKSTAAKKAPPPTAKAKTAAKPAPKARGKKASEVVHSVDDDSTSEEDSSSSSEGEDEVPANTGSKKAPPKKAARKEAPKKGGKK